MKKGKEKESGGVGGREREKIPERKREGGGIGKKDRRERKKKEWGGSKGGRGQEEGTPASSQASKSLGWYGRMSFTI